MPEPGTRWSLPLTTQAKNNSLDLATNVGMRQATFSFQLRNEITGFNKGFLHPLKNTVPQLTHDTTRMIKRNITLTFTPSETILINPLQDRVYLSMVFPTGQTFPLGVYMFTDKTEFVATYGSFMSAQLFDEMFIIDQEISESYDPAEKTQFIQLNRVGPSIATDVLPDVLADIEPTVIDYRIILTDGQTQSNWTIGTSRAQIVQDLCTQASYLSPWFDNHGVLQFVPSFDPALQVPTFDLDTYPRVIRSSISRTDDLLSAPNRFIVVSNTGIEDVPIKGVYDVPSSAPYSIAKRGFAIPQVFQVPLTGQFQANQAAAALGQKYTIFERAELDTPPDPRHDSYDVILWNGDLWLELGWTMELIEGGAMHHVMRKAYLDIAGE